MENGLRPPRAHRQNAPYLGPRPLTLRDRTPYLPHPATHLTAAGAYETGVGTPVPPSPPDAWGAWEPALSGLASDRVAILISSAVTF